MNNNSYQKITYFGKRILQYFYAENIVAVSVVILINCGFVELASASNQNPIPTPKVSAAPVGTHGFPFQTLVEDPATYGYVEDEVFIEGAAVAYLPSVSFASVTDGRWNATRTGTAAPYKTRLLIRRPKTPANFNGTVVVEWLNVTSGFDIDGFGGFREELVREGYAWVGVSAQAVGVNFLLNWESGAQARYASLVHPGDSYSYDIYSQAAQAILHPRAGDPAPLGKLTPRVSKLIASGASQSGTRLFTYVNSIQPTSNVFDGFIVSLAGQGAPLTQAPLPAVEPPQGAAALIRTDINTRVLSILTETEFSGFLGGPRGIHLQPDSKRFRLWEFPGASHAFKQGLVARTAQLVKSGIPAFTLNCDNPPMNDLDASVIARSGVAAMRTWIYFGLPPLSAPRAQLSIPADPAAPTGVVRDPVTGLALGGIRLPDIAAPIRTLVGIRPPAALATNPSCFLLGGSDPWNHDSDSHDGNAELDLSATPEPNLVTLYGNKDNYVRAVATSALKLVLQGYLRPYDAKDIIDKAKAVNIQ